MVPRHSTTDTERIYLASHREVEYIKSHYLWWYQVDANSAEIILHYTKSKGDITA